jgi:hypothetical protein
MMGEEEYARKCPYACCGAVKAVAWKETLYLSV